MPSIKEAASDFLEHKRIAVTGVSRTPGSHGSNVVYKRLRERGYDVFAVNPNAETVEGDPAYHDLHAIPGGVEAVVIGTRPERAGEAMQERASRAAWQYSRRRRPRTPPRRLRPRARAGASAVCSL